MLKNIIFTRMGWFDILFLAAILISFIYERYRKLQKAAQERMRNMPKVPLPPVVETVKSLPYKKPEFRKKLQPFKKVKPDAPLSNETEEVKQFWKSAEKNVVIATAPEMSEHYITADIHSGKVDWRKAIILNEVLNKRHF